jgi:hypothetical protein
VEEPALAVLVDELTFAVLVEEPAFRPAFAALTRRASAPVLCYRTFT